jgi:predicted double-glycine peptidase
VIRHPAPIVLQSHDHDCGPACVESILSWAGYTTDTAALLKATRATIRHGTDPEDLAAILEAARLRPVIDEHMSKEELVERLDVGPVIAAIAAYRSGHWVTVVGVTARRVIVMDPATNRRAYRSLLWSDWLRRWHDTDRRGRPRVRLGISVRARCRRHAIEKGIPE